MWQLMVLVLALTVIAPEPLMATSGGLNAEGCHNDRKGGTGYHCHRAPARDAPAKRPGYGVVSARGGGAYANCTAAREAGAAPVRRGDSGYGAHLDRDNDGVGCE